MGFFYEQIGKWILSGIGAMSRGTVRDRSSACMGHLRAINPFEDLEEVVLYGNCSLQWKAKCTSCQYLVQLVLLSALHIESVTR